MRSLKARYWAIRTSLPEQYSSYICFARAVRGREFSYEIISKYFNKLVEKGDYLRSERKGIVDYLYWLSHDPEEIERCGEKHNKIHE